MLCPVCAAPANQFLPYRGIHASDPLLVEGFRGCWSFRCTDCEHVFCDPAPPTTLLKRYYEGAGVIRGAPTPRAKLARSLLGEALLTLRAKLRLERWPVGVAQLEMVEAEVESHARRRWLADVRTLEIGAGSAVFSRTVRARSRRAVCHVAEPSPLFAATYRRNRLHVVASTLDDVPEDRRYDIVHSAHFLEHLADPKVAFEKLRRLVRPSGLVFTEVPNCEPPYWDVYRYPDPPHLQFFTPGSLRALARETGFAVCSLEGSGARIDNDVGLLLEDTAEVIDDDEIERLLAIRAPKLAARRAGLPPRSRGPLENLRMVMRPSPA